MQGEEAEGQGPVLGTHAMGREEAMSGCLPATLWQPKARWTRTAAQLSAAHQASPLRPHPLRQHRCASVVQPPLAPAWARWPIRRLQASRAHCAGRGLQSPKSSAAPCSFNATASKAGPRAQCCSSLYPLQLSCIPCSPAVAASRLAGPTAGRARRAANHRIEQGESSLRLHRHWACSRLLSIREQRVLDRVVLPCSVVGAGSSGAARGAAVAAAAAAD